MIQFACPGCEAVYSVGDEKGGKTSRCPRCDTQFQIPMPDGAAAATPPPPVSAPPTDTVEVACPTCSGALAVTATDVGASVECPFCKSVFTARPGAGPSAGPGRPRSSLSDVLDTAGGRAGDDRPSRRGRTRDEDEDDDRPSRRRRSTWDDEDDDRPSRRGRRRGRDVDDGMDEPDTLGQVMGIVSLVSGIAGLVSVICCCLGLLFALVAIVTGGIGLTRPTYRGMSLAGVIMGVFAIVLFVGMLVLRIGLGAAGNGWNPPPPNQNPPAFGK